MKLRLGPPRDASLTKMTVSIPAPLRTQLEFYAQLYSDQFSKPVDAQTLVPMILEMFLSKDRAFQRALRDKT
jgi:hypothetical protein